MINSATERASAAVTATGPKDAKVEPSANPSNAMWSEKPTDVEGVTKIDGDDLFRRVHAFLKRFICYPSEESSVAHLLWIAHAHFMEEWFSTPRLAALSPDPGSGKSRLLEITALLVPNPEYSVTPSKAYLVRRIADQDCRPTVLFDEADAIFGARANGDEDLRGVINAGYRRGATVGRCETHKGIVRIIRLPTYAAIAMGGLGDLPETILDRSIIIPMKKRAPGEIVESFQPRHHEAQGLALGQELEDWANQVSHEVGQRDPVIPKGIVDRDADVWAAPLRVAELAGGAWPTIGRATAAAYVADRKANKVPSLGTSLLADIRTCFGSDNKLATHELISRLVADEEAPWGDLNRREISPRELAKLLRQYGIRSKSVRLADKSTPKGYMKSDFQDAWLRYLPKAPESATSATAATH